MEAETLLSVVRLDKSSEIPLYAQVRDILLAEIDNGNLVAGARLPPVRRLAEAADVNVMTVARAYKELTEKGAIAGRGALGTFVTERRVTPVSNVNENGAPARETYQQRDVDTFGRMLQFSGRPGVVPLTRAYPEAATVDVASYEKHLQDVIQARPSHSYSYLPPDGLPSLKEAMSQLMLQHRSLELDPDEIIICNGGQQAINLVALSLLKAGDVVIVERPTYFGALELFRNLGVQTVGVQLEDDGPDIKQLELLVRSLAPKLIFLIPTFHNPTGITTSLEKRKAVLDISRRYGVPILEDDCCSELRYRGDFIPSIKSISSSDDLVYYSASMGKVYIPGIRLGIVAPPTTRLAETVRQKSIADLHTSSLLQNAFEGYIRSGAHEKSLKQVRRRYGTLLKVLAQELREHMPQETEFISPDGGLNLWLKLPPEIDSIDFFYACLQRNVGVLVGLHFYPDSGDSRTIRLSFGLSDKEKMTDAIAAMGAAAKGLMGRKGGSFPVVV